MKPNRQTQIIRLIEQLPGLAIVWMSLGCVHTPLEFRPVDRGKIAFPENAVLRVKANTSIPYLELSKGISPTLNGLRIPRTTEEDSANLILTWGIHPNFGMKTWLCLLPGGFTLYLVIPGCSYQDVDLVATVRLGSGELKKFEFHDKIRETAWLPFAFSKRSQQMHLAVDEIVAMQLSKLAEAIGSDEVRLQSMEAPQFADLEEATKKVVAMEHDKLSKSIGAEGIRLRSMRPRQVADLEGGTGILDGEEEAIAEAQFDDIKKRGEIYQDSALSHSLSERAIRILENWPKTPRGIAYRFLFLRSEELNAFSLPDGRIILTEGLVKNLVSIGGWDGVIAHEIAHSEEKHAARSLHALRRSEAGRGLGGALAGIAIGVLANNPSVMQSAGNLASDVIGLATNLSNSGFSKAQEIDADLLSLEVLTGEDDRKLFGDLLARLKDAGSPGGGPFSSHPALDRRISIIRSHRKENYSNGDYEHRDPSGNLVATLKVIGKSTYVDRTNVVKFWVRVKLIEKCPPMRKASAFQNAARPEFFNGLVIPEFGKQAKYRSTEEMSLRREEDFPLSFSGDFRAPNALPEAILLNTHGCALDFRLAKSQ